MSSSLPFLFFLRKQKCIVSVLNFEIPLYNYLSKNYWVPFYVFTFLIFKLHFFFSIFYYHHFFKSKLIFSSPSPFFLSKLYIFLNFIIVKFFLEENLICFKKERLGCNGFMVHFSSKIWKRKLLRRSMWKW